MPNKRNNKKKKKGFTLVELLAVIVILAVVILIAVTAVIPRMNSAKKKALIDEGLMYLNAAKEALVFDSDTNFSCVNISSLNEKYINKSSDTYSGVVKTEYSDGKLTQIINLTDGKFYIVGSDDLTTSDVKSTKPNGFASSCADYNPVIADGADTNTLAYKLLMSEGGSTIDDNLSIIDNRSSSVNFNSSVTSESDSGIYKTEDDDGASYYYRGVINNNWVEFGDFYWRVVRINGDGSVRMIYAGLKNSTHTANDSLIKSSKNSYTSSYAPVITYKAKTTDISGLTNTQIESSYANGRFGTTYIGYMFNPAKVLRTYPDIELNNSNRLNAFPTYTVISDTANYYFFKNFDMENDCSVGSDNLDDGACTLKCRSLNDDCVLNTWKNMADNNSSSTADGIYPATNPTQYVYTSDYKYICLGGTAAVTKANSDGTTSVYISCPIVSEIMGSLPANPTYAKFRYHGLFSKDLDTSNVNVLDSNIKTEVELWYESNIYNKSDNKTTPSPLEDYISDGIFCNDRTTTQTSFPFISFGSSLRVASAKSPSLKCPNLKNDGFTLGGNASSVKQSNKGNSMLKYPIGLLTADEVSFAGAKISTLNTSFYLNIGKTYWTMSPSNYPNGHVFVHAFNVNETRTLYNNTTSNAYGIRPVINLKASVLYDSGSGTEANPYKIKLAS